MDILWHGGTAISITTKTDTITLDHHHAKSTVTLFGKDQAQDTIVPNFIDWAGEYEINEHLFTGFPVMRAGGDPLTIFTMSIEEVNFGHLSNLDRKLSDKELEQLGNIDILFIPVGGQDAALTAKQAKEVIEQVDPSIVIPMLYSTGVEDLLPITDFLKEMGISNPEPQAKYSISKSKISADRTEVVILEAQQ